MALLVQKNPFTRRGKKKETRLRTRWTSGTHFIIPIVTPHLTSNWKKLVPDFLGTAHEQTARHFTMRTLHHRPATDGPGSSLIFPAGAICLSCLNFPLGQLAHMQYAVQ